MVYLPVLINLGSRFDFLRTRLPVNHQPCIKPIEQRRDPKTKKDQFDLQVWWREAAAKVPSWAYMYVLRAVLTDSIPPERCFSILNDTFDDDQTRSSADYIEYSLQSQYNARGRA